MVSSSASQASLWWNMRFLFLPAIPVAWVLLGLTSIGLNRRQLLLILAIICIVPVSSQFFIWTDSFHSQWVEHDIGWHLNGPYWIAETTRRVPGLWFTVFSFHGLLLWLAGTVLFLIAVWNAGRQRLLRSLIVMVPAFLVFANAMFPVFNIAFPTEYNFFTPGTGIGILLFGIGMIWKHDIYHNNEQNNHGNGKEAEKELHSQGIFVLIFAMMAAGILSAGYLSYIEFKQKFRIQTENNLSGIAKLKVFELQRWLKERSQDADILFENPLIADLIKSYIEQPGSPAIHSKLLESFSKYLSCTQYDQIALYDTKGNKKLSVPRDTRVTDPNFSAAVQEALTKGKVKFLDFRKDPGDGRIFLALIIPVTSPGGGHGPIGVITMRINPQVSLYQSIQESPIPSLSTESLLVRREGSEILYLSDLKFKHNTALSLRISLNNYQRPAVRAALGFTGITEGTDYRGIPVLADLRPVTGSPWFLVTKMDLKELYNPVQRRLIETAVFIFTLLAMAGAGLWLVWRQQRLHYYRKQMESAEIIRESEDKFRYIFENASVGKSLTYVSGEAKINRAFCEMLGYTTEELANIHWQDITYADDIEHSQKKMDLLMSGQQESAQFIKRYVHKNGTVVWGDVHTSLRRDADNIPKYYMTTVIDITERKRAEDEIVAAKVALQGLVEDQRKSQNEIKHLNEVLEKRVQERTAELQNTIKELESFSYSVSHDLRAPIRAIGSYMQIIMEEFESVVDPECKRMGRIVLDESKRMGQLIDDLLDFSRLGRHELKLVSIDMAEVARAVFTILSEPMDPNRIEFICGELPPVDGDPVLIRQLWANLIDNSLKFTSKKEKAVIRVGCNTESGRNIYFIRDNGAGFEMQYVDKIFGVFQRLHTDHEFKGTGVGLAIVQRVMQRHGGTIWAEGEPGKGATFYFSF